MSTRRLQASFASGQYPIHIGHNVLSQLPRLLSNKKTLVITNDTIAPLHLATLHQQLEDIDYQTLQLPDGEHTKNKNYFHHILDYLAEHKYHRDSIIIALGGGVITDLAGFTAASYHRGIDLVLIPTTLLAQIDAAIGGKTAINHPRGKNLIGAFYHPKAVLIDLAMLNTLPTREFRSGLIELIKAALVYDATFFTWIETHLDDLLNLEPTSLSYAIERSCQIKCDIVAMDEQEHGKRTWLNLGHTFGHAIEQQLGYGTWLHGEAVAWGIAQATELSQRRGLLSQQEAQRILCLLQRTQCLQPTPNTLTLDGFMAPLYQDKKIRNNAIRFILLSGIGQATVCDNVSKKELIQTIHPYFTITTTEALGAN